MWSSFEGVNHEILPSRKIRRISLTILFRLYPGIRDSIFPLWSRKKKKKEKQIIRIENWDSRMQTMPSSFRLLINETERLPGDIYAKRGRWVLSKRLNYETAYRWHFAPVTSFPWHSQEDFARIKLSLTSLLKRAETRNDDESRLRFRTGLSSRINLRLS